MDGMDNMDRVDGVDGVDVATPKAACLPVDRQARTEHRLSSLCVNRLGVPKKLPKSRSPGDRESPKKV